MENTKTPFSPIEALQQRVSKLELQNAELSALVLYDYQPGRGGEHPSRFLKGFAGCLQTDGYSRYNEVEGATQLGCWSHARRKFHEAQQSLPDPLRKQADTVAAAGLNFCNALFMLERKWTEVSSQVRYDARLLESKPLLDVFKVWLDEQRSQMLPKSLVGTAITYAINQWEKLNVFLQDGRLEIHNNRNLSSSLGNPHHSSDMRSRNVARE